MGSAEDNGRAEESVAAPRVPGLMGNAQTVCSNEGLRILAMSANIWSCAAPCTKGREASVAFVPWHKHHGRHLAEERTTLRKLKWGSRRPPSLPSPLPLWRSGGQWRAGALPALPFSFARASMLGELLGARCPLFCVASFEYLFVAALWGG